MRTQPLQNVIQHPASISPAVISKRPPIVRLHQSKILALFRAFDSLLIIGMLWVSLLIYQSEWTNAYTVLCLLSIVAFSLFAENNEVYYLWRGFSNSNLAYHLLVAWIETAVLLVLMALLIDIVSDVSIRVVLMWVVITPIIIITLHWARRLVLAKFRGMPEQSRRVAVVGANNLGARLIGSFKHVPWLGYCVKGYYDDRQRCDDQSRRLNGEGIEVLGGLEQLYEDAKSDKINIVFITLPMRAEARIQELMTRLADTTVSAYLIPDVFHFDLLHSRITGIQGIPALSIYDSPLADNSWTKRLEDIVLGLGILCVAALPMLAVAIGVKLSSPGPVFFKQTRYGMLGEKIKVWKFRSMTVCEDGEGISQAKREDPRVTPFGAFIRRTSLDELPQLFNVLSGSMSVVGPRPHAVAHNEFYRGQIKGYMLRHKVKPGITGLAQVSGFRGETETLDKMSGRIAYDLEYIRNWSVMLDLQILWWTLFRGFVGQQAY